MGNDNSFETVNLEESFIMRKNKVFIMVIILCFINIIGYSIDENYLPENILLDRGYTKFSPSEYFYTHIFSDTYTEIFQNDFRFANAGIRRVIIDIGDGFEYNLFYVLERSSNDFPNILVIVYLEKDNEIWGFYKKNTLLLGIETNIETANGIEYLLAFY